RMVHAAALTISLAACAQPDMARPSSAAPATRRILYLTQSAGFKHDVLPVSAQILESIGARSGAFSVTATEDPGLISRDGLSRYDAVVFFTTGELPMSDGQKAALLEFVRGGKGFVGVHSATDT